MCVVYLESVTQHVQIYLIDVLNKQPLLTDVSYCFT